MKLTKGDVLEVDTKHNNIVMHWLFCGYANEKDKENGIALLYDIECHKRCKVGVSKHFYFRTSKYAFEGKKVKVIKNIGNEKAEKYLNKYKELEGAKI